MSEGRLVDIACQVRKETNKAWLIHDGTKTEWVPKSQVEIYEDATGTTCTMPEWLAQEKGFI